MTKKIHLIRHGVTQANMESRFIGSTDMPLTSEGEAQARELANVMNKIKPDAVISSPLKRAMSTAIIALDGNGLEITTDPDLREAEFGKWEMLTYGEIVRDYKAETEAWAKGFEDFTFPEGESFANFSARVRRAVERMKASGADTVVAFTHGGFIGQALCQLLDIPGSRHITFRLPPTSVSTLEICDGMTVLSGINDPSFYS